MHINRLYTHFRRNLGTILLLLPVLLFGYVLYPSTRVLWGSFSRADEYSLVNYREFFDLEGRANLEALGNSLFISLGSVILSALIILGVLVLIGFISSSNVMGINVPSPSRINLRAIIKSKQ